MMLTGMQGVTPNVRRAMKAIEGAGSRVHRHALDPVAIEDVLRVPASVVKAVKAARATPAPRVYARVVAEAAEAALLANPTMPLADLVAMVGCAKSTMSLARARLMERGAIDRDLYFRESPKTRALVAAIRADGSKSVAEYGEAIGASAQAVHTLIYRLRAKGLLAVSYSVVDHA